jgi:hypothetical protein
MFKHEKKLHNNSWKGSFLQKDFSLQNKKHFKIKNERFRSFVVFLRPF